MSYNPVFSFMDLQRYEENASLCEHYAKCGRRVWLRLMKTKKRALPERGLLFSFSGHSVDESRFDMFVGGNWVEAGRSFANQDVHIAQEVCILHLQLHVLEILLVGGDGLDDELHIALVAF